jgi:hypothetical protein
VNYLNFFKNTGNVLPCKYCRESYKEYINEPSTRLNMNTMKSRETLTQWLYDIHNKVNDKLSVKERPSFEQVWKKYESFRSKCYKTVKTADKKGCTTAMNGVKKRCVIKVVDSTSSFGKPKKTIKLVSIKRSKTPGKKYTATFQINKRTKRINFGAKGMSDYTIHKDSERKKRYIKRHSKDLKTNDPTRAGYLSMFILWNKKSLKASIADYKRRLSVYNRTGKFKKTLS